MLDIRFANQNRTIKGEPGETLREAAIRNKLSLYPHVFKILNCRGRGLCTSCTVEIVKGSVSPRNEIENKNLARKLKNNPNLRLACQITLTENMGELEVKTHV
ncbi:MAG: (2Fe-2S)-binding protein [Nitrospinae bacterium CG11_big_fil_rev_8_21_14_0_20_56_8]|nr:MAG: (2Fe-2S)-binding protein [Nitrospinae bacterium CG11_big_fil_rev_8_21_14_0_20_56_8]